MSVTPFSICPAPSVSVWRFCPSLSQNSLSLSFLPNLFLSNYWPIDSLLNQGGQHIFTVYSQIIIDATSVSWLWPSSCKSECHLATFWYFFKSILGNTNFRPCGFKTSQTTSLAMPLEFHSGPSQRVHLYECMSSPWTELSEQTFLFSFI